MKVTAAWVAIVKLLAAQNLSARKITAHPRLAGKLSRTSVRRILAGHYDQLIPKNGLDPSLLDGPVSRCEQCGHRVELRNGVCPICVARRHNEALGSAGLLAHDDGPPKPPPQAP